MAKHKYETAIFVILILTYLGITAVDIADIVSNILTEVGALIIFVAILVTIYLKSKK